MEFVIESSSSRNSICANLDTAFQEQIESMEDDKYSFAFSITLKTCGDVEDGRTDNGGEKIAILYGRLFDEDRILNDGWTLDQIADDTDQDTYNAMVQLMHSKVFMEEIDADKLFTPLFNGYVSTVYIYPAFRKQGFGRYVFANLGAMIEHCLNVTLHCLAIYPAPQVPFYDKKHQATVWEAAAEQVDAMKQRMIRMIRKTDFKRIGNTGFYARNYAAAASSAGQRAFGA